MKEYKENPIARKLKDFFEEQKSLCEMKMNRAMLFAKKSGANENQKQAYKEAKEKFKALEAQEAEALKPEAIKKLEKAVEAALKADEVKKLKERAAELKKWIRNLRKEDYYKPGNLNEKWWSEELEKVQEKIKALKPKAPKVEEVEAEKNEGGENPGLTEEVNKPVENTEGEKFEDLKNEIENLKTLVKAQSEKIENLEKMVANLIKAAAPVKENAEKVEDKEINDFIEALKTEEENKATEEIEFTEVPEAEIEISEVPSPETRFTKYFEKAKKFLAQAEKAKENRNWKNYEKSIVAFKRYMRLAKREMEGKNNR